MSGQETFLPNVGELSSADGWFSVHHYLPIDFRATLLLVYQDIHGSGVTSGRCERGRFLNTPNRALIRGVRAWLFMQG